MGRRSGILVGQGQGVSDPMGTGRDGLVVCGQQPGIGLEDSTSHWATRGV